MDKETFFAPLGNTEAVELFNFIQNERDLYSLQVIRFQGAQRLKKVGEYNSCYLEANLKPIADMASIRYTREYCKGQIPSDMFPHLTRVDCAKLMVREFEIEWEAGNRW